MDSIIMFAFIINCAFIAAFAFIMAAKYRKSCYYSFQHKNYSMERILYRINCKDYFESVPYLPLLIINIKAIVKICLAIFMT
jgi:hypothetical protein